MNNICFYAYAQNRHFILNSFMEQIVTALSLLFYQLIELLKYAEVSPTRCQKPTNKQILVLFA